MKNIFDVMNKLPRINGFSTPIVGISWDNVEITSSTKYVKKLFVYLEDKRVLFFPGDLEYPPFCMKSILNIREFLTTQLMDMVESQVKDGKFLEESIRAMRKACQDILTSQQQFSMDTPVICERSNFESSVEFILDMVRFRSVFVRELCEISTHYNIEFETEELKTFISDNYEAEYELDRL